MHVSPKHKRLRHSHGRESVRETLYVVPLMTFGVACYLERIISHRSQERGKIRTYSPSRCQFNDRLRITDRSDRIVKPSYRRFLFMLQFPRVEHHSPFVYAGASEWFVVENSLSCTWNYDLICSHISGASRVVWRYPGLGDHPVPLLECHPGPSVKFGPDRPLPVAANALNDSKWIHVFIEPLSVRHPRFFQLSSC